MASFDADRIGAVRRGERDEARSLLGLASASTTQHKTASREYKCRTCQNNHNLYFRREKLHQTVYTLDEKRLHQIYYGCSMVERT
jgi:hypothetical protein